MDYFVAALRQNPELAIFLTTALGFPWTRMSLSYVIENASGESRLQAKRIVRDKAPASNSET